MPSLDRTLHDPWPARLGRAWARRMVPDRDTEAVARRRLRWFAVAAWTMLIYTTLPVAPLVWRAAVRASGGAARYLAAAVLAAAAPILLAVVLRRPGRLWRLSVLVCLGAAYAGVLVLLPLTAGERTHLLYYGVLAWLACRALQLDWSPVSSAALAVVVATVAGLGDELIQAALPNRVFEWKDVGLNALSGALASAVVLVLAAPPAGPEEP